MKIYFAGAIRGGREDAKLYEKIIGYLKEKGQVLTEHVGSTKTSWTGETSRKDEEGDFHNLIFGTVTGVDGNKIGVNGFFVNPIGLKTLSYPSK